MNLRQYAKGKPCMIRVPIYCTFNPEQTVLCHVRIVELPKTDGKMADLLAAFGCSPCHGVVDGQIKSTYTYAERRLLLLEGVMRTQSYLIERNLIKW